MHCLGIGQETVFVPLIFYQVSHLTNFYPDINLCDKLYINTLLMYMVEAVHQTTRNITVSQCQMTSKTRYNH